MICLFLTTSSEKLKVTLLKDNEVIFDRENINKNDHSSFLVPYINDAFKLNDIDFKSLDRIIVDIGPGSFTGTRIGVTDAKVYANAFNIPLFGISSLEMMIYDFVGYDYYVPVIEDKNDKLYYGIYDKNKKRVKEDLYTNLDNFYKILDSYTGKILIISHSNKNYEKYDCEAGTINSQKINENIMINNNQINPHLLKPNYIKRIDAESKL